MPFDRQWPELEVHDVQQFLVSAEDEGLTWEAKTDGAERVRPASVAKAVCGFANSDYGGYLLLGAAREDGAWVLSGLEPREPDLTTWASSAISAGVRPLPRWDVKTYSLENGRNCAVIRVWPAVDGPRLANSGILYLRVSGATIPVTDPALIERLWRRGQAALDRAEMLAKRDIDLLIPGPAPTERDITLKVTVVPVTGAEDIAGTIFRLSYAQKLWDLLITHVPPDPVQFLRRDGLIGQDFISQWAVSGFTSHAAVMAIARWDGSITVGDADRNGVEPGERWRPPTLRRVEQFVKVASEAATGMGGFGRAFLAIRAHPEHLIARWIDLDSPSANLDSIGRELDRIAGRGSWEPEPE